MNQQIDDFFKKNLDEKDKIYEEYEDIKKGFRRVGKKKEEEEKKNSLKKLKL